MPFVVPTAVAASITVVNGTFTLIQNCYKLHAVDEDLAICLELLAIADRDMNYARQQLWSRKSGQKQSFSSIDMEYFQDVIEKVDQAYKNLGRLVEGYRVQREVNSSISIGSRFRWVLQGKDKFTNRQEVLRMAHSRLVGTIPRLGNVVPYNPQSPPLPPPPYTPPSYHQSYTRPNPQLASLRDTKILRSPSQQRALKGKSSMLLRPEVTVSEVSSNDIYSAPFLPSVPRDSTYPRSSYGARIESVTEESEFGEYVGH
jgi:hypothetical protein